MRIITHGIVVLLLLSAATLAAPNWSDLVGTSSPLAQDKLERLDKALDSTPGLLSNNVARIHGKGRVSPLVYGIEAGDVGLVTLLLDKGADPNSTVGPGKRPPLHFVFTSELEPAIQLDLCRLLVASGATINSLDSLERNIFHAFVESNPTSHSQAVGDFLKAEGADLAQEDVRGITPLLSAVMRHYPRTVTLLLDLGADPAQVTEGLQLDAYQLAQQQRHTICHPHEAEQIVDILAKRKQD